MKLMKLLLPILCLCSLAADADSATFQKPNIVFILADDKYADAGQQPRFVRVIARFSIKCA